MNVASVPYHAFPTIGYAISAVQTGKASLPVSPSSYIYSQFKHVSGVPAPDGVSGVNINKLKIIDTLIEQLSKLKERPEVSVVDKEQDVDKRISALIDQFQTKMKTMQANGNTPYVPAAPQTGAIFNIAV